MSDEEIKSLPLPHLKVEDFLKNAEEQQIVSFLNQANDAQMEIFAKETNKDQLTCLITKKFHLVSNGKNQEKIIEIFLNNVRSDDIEKQIELFIQTKNSRLIELFAKHANAQQVALFAQNGWCNISSVL